MIDLSKRIAIGCLLASLTALVVHGQWLNYPTPGIPRTADGKPKLDTATPRLRNRRPDISGMWGDVCMNGSDCFATKSMFFDIMRGAPKPVDMTPWATEVQQQRFARDKIDDPYASCLPPGIPRMYFNNPFKIVVTSGSVVFLHESAVGSTFRQVYTDGRAFPPVVDPTRLGYSIGRWEGDTFVVESRGFRDGLWLDTTFARPTSDALRLTQRFTRTAFGHMLLSVTIDDPKAFVAPFTVTTNLMLQVDTDLLEGFCDNQKNILPHYSRQPGASDPPSPRTLPTP
jgi:hypothetical protein